MNHEDHGAIPIASVFLLFYSSFVFLFLFLHSAFDFSFSIILFIVRLLSVTLGAPTNARRTV